MQFLKYFHPVNYSTPIKISSTLGYGPFGTTLEGRNWSVGSEYRYGFQAQECDDEVFVDNCSYAF
ncbi:MAG: hypothetical protein IPI31_14325 [Bacteroidetes bacterium]|jgi:hypothetical protein|nr:hypothetical protein [Bacteroidota bacterium]MBP8893598.1 hypothetical protein [Saprospiraceae bacterium]